MVNDKIDDLVANDPLAKFIFGGGSFGLDPQTAKDGADGIRIIIGVLLLVVGLYILFDCGSVSGNTDAIFPIVPPPVSITLNP